LGPIFLGEWQSSQPTADTRYSPLLIKLSLLIAAVTGLAAGVWLQATNAAMPVKAIADKIETVFFIKKGWFNFYPK
jgi:hypothetical protein